jgi:hypothetical protein
MTLDYIHNINSSGEHIIRLYNFNQKQSGLFQQLIKAFILRPETSLDLTTIAFIHPRNCTLMLRIAEENLGIHTQNKTDFFCDLTLAGYEQMVLLLEPFCQKETKAYQWLYDLDNPIDFLFSPAGTW